MSKPVQCQGSPCHLPCNQGRDCSEQPVVIRNQGSSTLWYPPRRADLSLVSQPHELETYRISHPDNEVADERKGPAGIVYAVIYSLALWAIIVACIVAWRYS